MPIGEIIGEIILRSIIGGLSYLTGYIILKGVTLGAIRLAPITSEGEHYSGRKKRRKIDWGIWLERPGRGRMLKAEVVCIVGMLAWGAAGLGIYLEHRGKEAEKGANLLSPGRDGQKVAGGIVKRNPRT